MTEWQMWAILGGMLALGARVKVGLALHQFAASAFLTCLAAVLGVTLEYQLNVFLLSAAVFLAWKKGGSLAGTNLRDREFERIQRLDPRREENTEVCVRRWR